MHCSNDKSAEKRQRQTSVSDTSDQKDHCFNKALDKKDNQENKLDNGQTPRSSLKMVMPLSDRSQSMREFLNMRPTDDMS